MAKNRIGNNYWIQWQEQACVRSDQNAVHGHKTCATTYKSDPSSQYDIFDLLLSLARAVGRVCSREQLLLSAADRDFEAFDRSIDVHIWSLRRKLGDDSRAPRFLETVRGVGYRMRRPGADSWS